MVFIADPSEAAEILSFTVIPSQLCCAAFCLCTADFDTALMLEKLGRTGKNPFPECPFPVCLQILVVSAISTAVFIQASSGQGSCAPPGFSPNQKEQDAVSAVIWNT